MKTYYVSPNKSPTRRRVLSTLLSTAIAVVILVLVDRVILRRQVDPIDIVAFAVFFGAWTVWSGPEPGFDLEVDDTEIRVVRDGSVRSKISRDRVRYVSRVERQHSLDADTCHLSHGPVAMRFLRIVAVPNRLPEYD